MSGIERGAECARYEPLLSALADGEASAEQLAILRPHMRTCLSCRARLREFRAAPERVAALVPPAVLVAADGAGPVRSLIESVAGLGDRLHAAAELATGQKIAAVAAASAAALAGGGTAIDEFANHQGPPLPEPVEQVEAQPVTEEPPAEPAPPAAVTPPADAAPAPSPAPAPEQPPPPPPPDPANEFAPAAAPATPAPAPAPLRPSGGGGSGGSAGGSGEFAP